MQAGRAGPAPTRIERPAGPGGSGRGAECRAAATERQAEADRGIGTILLHALALVAVSPPSFRSIVVFARPVDFIV